MPVIFRFLLLGCFFPFLFLTSPLAHGQDSLQLRDIWRNPDLQIVRVDGFNVLQDGKHYTRLENGEINVYRMSDGKEVRTIFSKPDSMPAISDYSLSQDEQKLLLFTDKTPVYRRSIRYRVWYYDMTTGKLQLIDPDKVLHATFSPAGNRVAYVKHNNLYLLDLENMRRTQVTEDGVANQIINGNCDWVYEEEFGFTRAYQWSPDGQYLAYYRFDERRVKEYSLYFYDSSGNYPRTYTYKYPKAGEDNSLVEIRFYDLTSGQTVTADLGPETDQYIPRIKWMPAGENLCVFRLNRHQNKLDLLRVNRKSGRSEVIFSEQDKYYIEINDNLTFLPDGQSFLFNSERDGYNHLYQWNWRHKQLKQVTKGAWDVDKMVAVDQEKKTVYYTAGKQTPLERKLYRVDWDGSKTVCLTPDEGTHEITPYPGNRYFLDAYSSITKVPEYRLLDASGKVVRVIEDNDRLAKKMATLDLGQVSFLKIPNAVGDSLNAYMIRPPGFDPAGRYPVLMYQYSGPGSQQVQNKFPLDQYFWHQYMAQQGYLIVVADGRGTGGRGVAFKKQTYLQLGKLESDDQIAVARYLATQPYVDGSRIGIWGWSFGGFISATCILKGADVFKTAVAVAPVTNWRYYDNIYTERYMRRPEENQEGYDANAPVLMADRLQGNFLFIHGLADDNVHFQNSAMLAAALVKANKQFETAYYPNKNHSIYGGVTREQLFRKITRYLLEHL